MTFTRGLDWYFNGSDGYQPPIAPANGEWKPLTQKVGHQARVRAEQARTPKDKEQ